MDTENNTNNKKQEVEVIIKRHKQLFDLLRHPNELWKVLLSLFLIIVIVFIGLAIVVISIKRYYPYNVIETNLQGASIMKSEDKDVIYWLFNSADLWANSGIEVSEGDELTIRASGASYTAIHHLVDASDSNRIPEDRWVDTEGQPEGQRERQRKTNDRDILRGAYRISPMSAEGILLMQVIPSNMQNNSDTWLSQKETGKYLVNGQIEIIGKERRNLRISQDGVLHFAVNDIVLTDSILKKMYREYIDSLSYQNDFIRSEKNTIINTFDSIGYDSIGYKSDDNKLLDTLIKKNISVDNSTIEYAKSKGLALGHYPICKTDLGTIDSLSEKAHNAYPIVNELVYYKQKHFRDPWYVDNIGSFLIVIERKRK